MFPVVSRDMQQLYFTRRINKFDEDIFVAQADSCGGWLRADNAGRVINSPNEELATCVSADGHYLFFTRCGIKSDNGWDGGGCDLYMSYRVSGDSNWYFPEPFGATINSPAYEGMPSLSPDNRELYFVSDRPGGYGGTDIWIAKFEDGLWQLPVNAGPLINSAGNESSPFIGEDNRTLYFSSDGHAGMGGYDLFVAHKKTDSTWEAPQNLGYPINTAFDEVSECVAGNGSKLIFASDRYAKKGNFDLYETEIPARLRPEPVCYIRGYVYDSITKDRLNDASMYIMDYRKGDTIYRFQSNRGDGSYVMLLRTGYKYLIHTARLGYTPVNDTLSLEFDHRVDSMQHNVDMLASDYLAPIHDSLLATIHFDLNKVELTASDKKIIRDAINPWLLEKRYVLHVNGYTDNTGTPMLNEELSTKRAKLVANEIINMGVDELMMETHGWGEAKMIAPNDNEEHQKMNRRVEITLSR
jgi:outer membrane protein OmpA-like peptidoglycan-associated protein